MYVVEVMGKVKGSDACVEGKDLWWKRRDIVRSVYMTADSDCVSTMGARALCLV